LYIKFEKNVSQSYMVCPKALYLLNVIY